MNDNEKLSFGVSIAGISVPPVVVDVTKNDAIEDAIDDATTVIDLADANPGNGAIDIRTVVKFKGITIPVTFTIDVVE
jgi:hypothetical protein